MVCLSTQIVHLFPVCCSYLVIVNLLGQVMVLTLYFSIGSWMLPPLHPPTHLSRCLDVE
jgi:hypothetical protein